MNIDLLPHRDAFYAFAIRAVPDQTALVRAACSGSNLFAHGNMAYLILHNGT